MDYSIHSVNASPWNRTDLDLGNKSRPNGVCYTGFIPSYSIVLIIFFSIQTLFGTVGNLLAILAITTTRQLWKASNFYILNLSIADFLVCSICAPYNIKAVSCQHNPGCCEIIGFVSGVSMITSLLTLAAIAVNRYLLLKLLPPKYEQYYSPFRTGLSIVIIWLLSLLGNMVPMIGGHAGYDRMLGFCVVLIINEHDHGIYLYSFSIGLVYGMTSFIICIASYKGVWKVFRNSVQSVGNPSGKRLQDQFILSRNLLILTTIFCIFWGPQMVVAIVEVFLPDKRSVPAMAHRIFTFLAFSNSALNPVLYGIFNKNIAKAYKEFFRCHLICRSNNYSANSVAVE